jgi:hypothetical protein
MAHFGRFFREGMQRAWRGRMCEPHGGAKIPCGPGFAASQGGGGIVAALYHTGGLLIL